MTKAVLARAQGAYYAISGVWPLLHIGSFEAITGPKEDRWLVQTVGGLLLVNGAVQVASADSPDGHRAARLLGLGTAGTLMAIDVIYVAKGRIRSIYLLDAAVELGLIAAWLAPRPQLGGRVNGTALEPA